MTDGGTPHRENTSFINEALRRKHLLWRSIERARRFVLRVPVANGNRACLLPIAMKQGKLPTLVRYLGVQTWPLWLHCPLHFRNCTGHLRHNAVRWDGYAGGGKVVRLLSRVL